MKFILSVVTTSLLTERMQTILENIMLAVSVADGICPMMSDPATRSGMGSIMGAGDTEQLLQQMGKCIDMMVMVMEQGNKSLFMTTPSRQAGERCLHYPADDHRGGLIGPGCSRSWKK